MIGHDIIDLKYEDHPSRWKEERYWQKVLVQEELAWVKNQESPFESFLICWAIKEAAYKLICKTHPQHLFIPNKFIVRYLAIENNYDSIYFYVFSPIGELWAQVRTSSQFVQASVSSKQIELNHINSYTFPLKETDYSSQSQQTQKEILAHLRTKITFDKGNLEIRKKNSVPALYLSGKEIPIDISISHHGQWGAFAYVDTPI